MPRINISDLASVAPKDDILLADSRLLPAVPSEPGVPRVIPSGVLGEESADEDVSGFGFGAFRGRGGVSRLPGGSRYMIRRNLPTPGRFFGGSMAWANAVAGIRG